MPTFRFTPKIAIKYGIISFIYVFIFILRQNKFSLKADDWAMGKVNFSKIDELVDAMNFAQ